MYNVPFTLTADPSNGQDPDIIRERVWCSRYDVAFRKSRRYRAKAADPANRSRRAVFTAIAELHEARMRSELHRDQTDTGRRQNAIDEWRATDGRELYNTRRRKVRIMANECLDHLSPAEKAQRKKDQMADANWKKRQLAAGLNEAQIMAAFAIRLAEREAKRSAVKIDQKKLQDDPTFGLF